MKKTIVAGLLFFSAFSAASLAGSLDELRADVNFRWAGIMLAHAGHSHADQAGTGATSQHAGHGSVQSAAASVSSTLSVSGCWIRALPSPAPSAGYFIVKNTGAQSAELVSAASAAFGMIMLHQTTDQDGMSKMSMVHGITIPPGGELAFKPGGYHAMLEQAVPGLTIGTDIKMELMFGSGEKAVAVCQVKAPNTVAH